ncbi:UDP-GalNAc:beta-1,3-N-acetylgalactosaminyltransferase 2-like [Ornithodoros turicata]|uniref:UDP-GalNAc:beta-1, 3-N-acetylgalactosaminyltransferase 2-like n=1 Tax=Ornithodoros turicata TaxID=34597 RepID=UPI0031393F2F
MPKLNCRNVTIAIVAIAVQIVLLIYFFRRTILLVGVLSARHHFDRRAAARETWLHLGRTSRVKSYFIVGRDACTVPPNDRIDPYVCQRWQPNLTQITDELEFYATSAKGRDCSRPGRILYTGFSFEAHHPISISRLGVLSDILIGSTGVTVALIDAHTREVMRKTVVSTEHGREEDGYVYRTVDRVVLKRYFEGIISLTGEIITETCSSALPWNNGSHLISFERLYIDHEEANSVTWYPGAISGVGVRFVVSDFLPSLTEHVSESESRQMQWDAMVNEEQSQLLGEAHKYGDIILVPVVDVYRNLATKMLTFFDVLLQKSLDYDFFFKTDDDCLVHLEKVRDMVPRGQGLVWWSSFRENWPVARYGKWGDHDYTSAVYPSFACGSGYVLSREIVLWLAKNKDHLHQYQGEDVSMGIWLAALRPKMIDDDFNWTCGYRCVDGVTNALNRAELSPAEVRSIWAAFKKTGKLC